MEKNVLGKGQYATTGIMFIRGEFKPGKTRLALSEQGKEAILKCLTESDEFHKLVCDITGVERKQKKVSPELEKLKEEYSYVCDRYKKEQQKSNYLLNKWRKETARRLDAEKERDNAEKHHKFIVDEIFSMLKEVECSSVRGIVDELKAERLNVKLVEEQCEIHKEENDMLSKRFSDLEKSYFCIQKEANEIKNSRKNLSANYDRLIEDYNCLNTRYNNQKEYIAEYIEENKRLINEVEKLKGRLNRAAKNYGELIKTISDKAMKSI